MLVFSQAKEKVDGSYLQNIFIDSTAKQHSQAVLYNIVVVTFKTAREEEKMCDLVIKKKSKEKKKLDMTTCVTKTERKGARSAGRSNQWTASRHGPQF